MFLEEIRDVIDHLEQGQDCLPRDIPNGCRERRRVWTVVADSRQYGYRCVYNRTRNARREDDVPNGVMNVKQGNDESCQEQEDGYMEESWDGLHDDGKMETGNTLGKE